MCQQATWVPVGCRSRRGPGDTAFSSPNPSKEASQYGKRIPLFRVDGSEALVEQIRLSELYRIRHCFV